MMSACTWDSTRFVEYVRTISSAAPVALSSNQTDKQQASQQIEPLLRVGRHPHDRQDRRAATDDLNGHVHEQLRDAEHEQRYDGANRRYAQLG